jgi:hypothetical protein
MEKAGLADGKKSIIAPLRSHKDGRQWRQIRGGGHCTPSSGPRLDR